MQKHSRRSFVSGMALSGLTAGGLVDIPLLGASSAMAQTGSGRGLLLGVNFAGAEFNAIGGRWHWPKLDNLQYYLGKGFRIFRIPFLWERLQPQLHGELDNDALSGLETILGMLEQAGAIALLDAHNYGRRQGQIIGDPGSPWTSAPLPISGGGWAHATARGASSGTI
jgi:endoglucanase